MSHAGAVKRAPVSRAYHHGNLRRTLLDRALALFAERGSFDFTLRELARAAGVTHNAPYRHFSSKTELRAALRDEGLGLLADRAKKGLARAGDSPRGRVRALGEAYVRFALSHPEHFRLISSETRDSGAPEPNEGGSFQLLEQVIAEGQAHGGVRRDLSARELALAAWAIVHGLASLLASGLVPRGEARVARYSELMDAVFWQGVAVSGSDAARTAASRVKRRTGSSRAAPGSPSASARPRLRGG